MKTIIAGILLFLSVFCFAQTDGFYQIQVGAFRESANAQAAVSRMRNAGLNPVTESIPGLTRVRLTGISAEQLPALLNRVRSLGFSDPWVSWTKAEQLAIPLFTIQVGAFRHTANAENAFNRARNAGFNPSYENYREVTRVVITGVESNNVPLIVQKLHAAGFPQVWIREHSAMSSFSIIVNSGAVTQIIPSDNTEPLTIIQTIPSFINAASTDNTYQADSPMVFFFNELLYLDSLEGNIVITADGIPVNGTIVINEGADGFAVLTFIPANPLPEGAQITATIRRELQDSSGNTMTEDHYLAYIAERGLQTVFNRDNLGFEAGDEGVVFLGDGAISTTRGPLIPFESNHYAAVSTGTRIVSSTGIAIGNTTSQVQLGPIMEPFSSLTFYYDFISAEFNEYVGSRYDDTAMITIHGPLGVHNEIITSVNIIAFENEQFIGYPGMPDTGDFYAGHIGWQRFSIENINVGTPAYIVFSITDVGDDIYSSILVIDALELR